MSSHRYESLPQYEATLHTATSARRQIDEDDERLPDGMRRVGYDADTQTYTFRDEADGSLWEGEPGSRYGTLRRQGDRRVAVDYDDEVLKQAKREDWRYMAPFFLLVALVLLVVWRFFGAPIFTSGGSGEECPQSTVGYRVAAGDTCWAIAEEARTTVEELGRLNRGLECERLQVGRRICVPPVGEGGGR